MMREGERDVNKKVDLKKPPYMLTYPLTSKTPQSWTPSVFLDVTVFRAPAPRSTSTRARVLGVSSEPKRFFVNIPP